MRATFTSSEAVAASNVPARKFPTKLHILCNCGHQGFIQAFIDKPPRLACSKCGNRNPRIAAADRSRTWSMQRAGK